ncbi:MAG: cation:proton antiporter, partial [Clostridiales bacterium]
TTVIIAVVSCILKESYFLDVALVYALISFAASMAIANFIEGRGSQVD